MFEMLPQSNGKIVGIRATGKLTDADYQEFMPELELLIEEHGSICLLVDLEGFDGWEPLAAWDDFTFGMTHWHHFDKIAIVGDALWEKLAAQATNLLMKGEARYFDLSQRNDAWVWVQA
ncbi:MAG: STAS/SEC14 domain-containing protein [Rhodospirillales bacterium]|nr:STAS/SEC14 domain-containing protein [Rhodospirillales bacterium]